jgi:hypothetical protein
VHIISDVGLEIGFFAPSAHTTPFPPCEENGFGPVLSPFQPPVGAGSDWPITRASACRNSSANG